MIIRMLEDPAIPNEATFAYVVKDSNVRCLTFWIAKNGISVKVMERIPEQPTYLLLDDVESALNMRGEKLNLGLTSSVLKEFQKRVFEARDRGKYYVMLALDLNVMTLLFPDLSLAVRQFRFDVLGGNPRIFLCNGPSSISRETVQLIYPELQSCISIFFGADYHHMQTTPEGSLARWAIRVIASEVERSDYSDSSLFRAEFASEDSSSYAEGKFATAFLRAVAGTLYSKNDAHLSE